MNFGVLNFRKLVFSGKMTISGKIMFYFCSASSFYATGFDLTSTVVIVELFGILHHLNGPMTGIDSCTVAALLHFRQAFKVEVSKLHSVAFIYYIYIVLP